MQSLCLFVYVTSLAHEISRKTCLIHRHAFSAEENVWENYECYLIGLIDETNAFYGHLTALLWPAGIV